MQHPFVLSMEVFRLLNSEHLLQSPPLILFDKGQAEETASCVLYRHCRPHVAVHSTGAFRKKTQRLHFYFVYPSSVLLPSCDFPFSPSKPR